MHLQPSRKIFFSNVYKFAAFSLLFLADRNSRARANPFSNYSHKSAFLGRRGATLQIAVWSDANCGRSTRVHRWTDKSRSIDCKRSGGPFATLSNRSIESRLSVSVPAWNVSICPDKLSTLLRKVIGNSGRI